jgi:peptidoglycan hydrolase-like protein with peptidoglycan-binding domain
MGDESLLKRLIFCSILAAFLLFIPGSDRAGASVQIIDNTDYPTLYLAQVPLQGEAVWLVQARLKEMGYDIEPNGVFDKTTSNTISMFQLSVGMKADGIVNEAVWQALLASEEGDSLCAADEQGEKGRMLIVIDVAHRTLVLYEDDKEVCRYPVAVGKAKTPTPLGEWKVIHKGMEQSFELEGES